MRGELAVFVTTMILLRRPLIGITVAYLAGTAYGFHVPIAGPWSALLLVIVMGACAAVVIRDRNETTGTFRHPDRTCIGRSVLLLVCTLSAAWIRAGLHGGVHDATAEPPDGMRIRIRGIIISDPYVTRAKSGDRQTWKLVLRSSEINSIDETWRPWRHETAVVVYGGRKERRPKYGEEWDLAGTYRRTQVGLHERQKSLSVPQQRGRSGVLHVPGYRAQRSKQAVGWRRLFQGCLEGRFAAEECLRLGINDFPEHSGLLQAIILGRKHTLSLRTRQTFVLTGTLHIFAISGSHVAVIAMLIVFVLRFCRVPRMYWGIWLTPLLVAYTLATGASSSAVRACVMAVMYFLAPLLGRRPDVPSALAAAALLIIVVKPNQIFDLGFILSFVAVIGILTLYRQFMRLFCAVWERDPWILVQAESKRTAIFRHVMRHTSSLAAMSCSAWLVSTPLTSFYFGNFSLIALVSNIVVVPLAFLSVLTGSLAIVMGMCTEWLADVFNHANVAFIATMMGCTKALSRVPWGSYQAVYMPTWMMIAWYGALAGVVLWARAGGEEKTHERPGREGDYSG